MTLASGSRLGPYEILSPLGAGGMGEVYKARDTRLERTVAIKVLPQHLAASPEVRQRFEREAKMISHLSHPHICALYDVGSHEGTEYLVMELLEGETLAARLAKGPLPLEQTLRFGVEIADALDKAHRLGIVHRDLKPGNVMLTKSGVKLLDFGLAKVLEPEAPIESLTSAPTAAKDVTKEGTILGTLSYMAPEQLEGKKADPRTDIFALGATLYEMATGRKAFSGSSQASLISAILRDDPKPISQVQPMSPPALDRVVRTSLAKDPEDRWQSARDLASELKWIAQEGSQAGAPATLAARRGGRERIAWAITAAAALAAAVLAVRLARHPRPAEALAVHFTLPVSSRTLRLKVSPDGTRIAYIDGESGSAVWIRPLNAPEARMLKGTEGTRVFFWSADSRSLAFFTMTRLMRVGLEGEPPEAICEALGEFQEAGAWGNDGTILFTQGRGLYRVPASGGKPSLFTARGAVLDAGSVRLFSFLPGGRWFLIHLEAADPEKAGLYVGSLDGTLRRIEGSAEWRSALYAPPGYLLTNRSGSLVAQPFDAEAARTTGPPVSLVEQSGPRGLSVSESGVLTYVSGKRAMSRLAWFDRSGKRLGDVGDPGPYDQVALAPDGRRAVVNAVSTPSTGAISLVDLTRGVITQLSSPSQWEVDSVWTPDGNSLISCLRAEGGVQLFLRNLATGNVTPLLVSGDVKYPDDVSRDGRFVVYHSATGDISVLPLSGDRKPVLYLHSDSIKDEPHFSPDGRWLVYESEESGTREVWSNSFPKAGAPVRVSTKGGGQPRWRGDGKELFYVAPDGVLMSVPITQDESAIKPGLPVGLFRLPVAVRFGQDQYDNTPDGQRFLVLADVKSEEPALVHVVVNWTSMLKKRPE